MESVSLPTTSPVAAPPPQTREAARRDPGPATAAPAAASDRPSPDTAQISAEAEHALTEQEREHVEQLRRQDREVRRHEQAHQAAAGPHAKGAPSYEYQQGPDGRRYAVSGHVDVDMSAVEGDPEATVRKMETIRRAAMAPAEPSSKDRQVAAQAAQKAQDARMEQVREADAETEAEAGDEPALDVYA